jgi:hypothetical protein
MVDMVSFTYCWNAVGYLIYFSIFCFFWWYWSNELRVLCLVKFSTTWATPWALFALVIFLDMVSLYAQASLGKDPTVCAPHVGGMICHHWLIWGLVNVLPSFLFSSLSLSLSMPLPQWFELRALYLVHAPALFALIILETGSCFFLRPSWTASLLF